MWICPSQTLTVHLHQQLVQSVLLLALTAEVSSSSLPPHSVDLIDEEDAGGVLPRHGEHVPHLRRRKHSINMFSLQQQVIKTQRLVWKRLQIYSIPSIKLRKFILEKKKMFFH